MGTAGTLSVYFVLPQMGKIFDSKAIEAAGGEAAFKCLTGDGLERVKGIASGFLPRCGYFAGLSADCVRHYLAAR